MEENPALVIDKLNFSASKDGIQVRYPTFTNIMHANAAVSKMTVGFLAIVFAVAVILTFSAACAGLSFFKR